MPVDVVKRRRSRGIDVDAAAIREARLAAGLSLAELAMGSVSRQAMHLIESGRSRPSPRVLQHIAAKTGRSASDFYATARRAGRSGRQRAQHSAPVVELERLIAIRAFTEATERGRELLDELEGTPDEPSIRLLLGEALVMTRQPDQGLMHLRLARAAFDDGLDQWGSIAATDLEGMALYLLDDPTCLTVLEDALRRARLLDPAVDSMQVKILTHIATVHVSRHAWYEALRYYEEATKSSDNVRDLAQRARTYDGLSQAYARLGQTARAIGYANRALALYATQTDLAGVYRAENNLGDLLLQIGEVDAAEPHLRRAFDGCQSMGLDRRGSGYVLVNLAELAFRRGRVSEAQSLLSRANTLALELGEKVVQANSELLLGRITSSDQKPAASRRHFAAAIDLLTSLNMPDRLREAHLEYGRMLRSRGDLAAAADQFERAAELPLHVVATDSSVEAWA